MRKNTISKFRDDTYKEAMQMLNEHGKCAIIRPTGFGKTGILTRVLRNYHNVLFLYYGMVEEAVYRFYYGEEHYNEYDYIPGVRFESYMKIAYMSREEMKEEFKGIDLIICDECHRLGGKITHEHFQWLIEEFPNVHRLGATATPERMDLVDVISDFFDNKTTSVFNLHDAFKHGFLKKPYYCYCSYGKNDLDELARDYRKNYDRLSTEEINIAEDLLESRIIEISNLQNMSEVLKDCMQYVEKKDYLKFIVFFSSFEHMRDKEEEVRDWFSSALPKYGVRITKVSSEKKEYTDNIDIITSMPEVKGRIDLIYCVNMLTVSYHINNLTGILMYRGTASGIVYQQQLGRILNQYYSGLVIDVVDNIHRKALYDNLGRPTINIRKKRKRLQDLRDKVSKGIELTMGEQEELAELEDWEAIIDDPGNKGKNIRYIIDPEDLIVIGKIATYRELIAKTVAEPVAMRCRQAWARWKECGGNDQPLFREYIEARGLATAGRQDKDMPLWPFCDEKNVTVNKVLDVIGVPKLPDGETVVFED